MHMAPVNCYRRLPYVSSALLCGTLFVASGGKTRFKKASGNERRRSLANARYDSEIWVLEGGRSGDLQMNCLHIITIDFANRHFCPPLCLQMSCHPESRKAGRGISLTIHRFNRITCYHKAEVQKMF